MSIEEVASRNNWTIINTECLTSIGARCLYGVAILDAGSEYKAFVIRGRKEARLLASIPKSIRIISCSDCWRLIDDSEHYFYTLDGLVQYLKAYIHVPVRGRVRIILKHVFNTIGEVGEECKCGGGGSRGSLAVRLSWDELKLMMARAYCSGVQDVEECIRRSMGRRLIVIIPKDDLPGMSATIYVELHGTPPKAYAILTLAGVFRPDVDDTIITNTIHIFTSGFSRHRVLKGYYALSMGELKNRKDTALYILPDIKQVMKEG